MSNLYSKHHDKVIENFLNTNQDLKSYSKDKFLLAKTKSGFVTPVSLQLKPMNMGMQGYNFVGNFKVDKVYKNYAYFLLDNEGVIEGFSSSCISVLKQDVKFL